MALIDKIDSILIHIEENKPRLAYNSRVFSVLEGEILPLIHEAIDRQLTGESAQVAKDRLPPINVLKKVVSKLSTLYSVAPERDTEKASDKALMTQIASEIDIDSNGASCNENFNAVKYGMVEIYVDGGVLKVRPCEPDLYLPYSDSPTDKTKPTVMIKFMGSYKKSKKGGALTGTEKANQIKDASIYHLYSDDEFLIIDSDGDVLFDEMMRLGFEDGINPFGVMPFSMVQRSKYSLIPKKDDDMLAMTVLIPLLMGEINFGVMFLANPIIYGLDINLGDLKISPLTTWSIQTNTTSGTQGKLDVLKPDMNIKEQSDWIKEQLAMWLESKNIKAKHLLSQSSGSVTSGIALILEEMDTTEDRATQAVFFSAFEADLWYKIGKIHNALVGTDGYSMTGKFSDNLVVKTTFKPVPVIEDEAQKTTSVVSRVAGKVISRRTAIEKLNPSWSEDRVNEELERIAEEVKLYGELQPQNNDQRPA